MAEQIVSPGVFTRENDLSFIQPAPLEAGTAFVGPTVKGPVEQPTVVTSYNEFVRKFGDTFESGSTKQEFLTSVAVRNFFSQGGSTALITRVTPGDFTAAETTNILSSLEIGSAYATGSGDIAPSSIVGANRATGSVDIAPGTTFSSTAAAGSGAVYTSVVTGDAIANGSGTIAAGTTYDLTFATGSAGFGGNLGDGEEVKIIDVNNNNIEYRFIAQLSTSPLPLDTSNEFWFHIGASTQGTLDNLVVKINSLNASSVVIPVSASSAVGAELTLSGSAAGPDYNGIVAQTGSNNNFSQFFVLGGGTSTENAPNKPVDGDEFYVISGSTTYTFVSVDGPVPVDDTVGHFYYFPTGSTAAETAANLVVEINNSIDTVVSASSNLVEITLSGSEAGIGYNGIEFHTGSTAGAAQFTLAGGTDTTVYSRTIVDGDYFNVVDGANSVTYNFVAADAPIPSDSGNTYYFATGSDQSVTLANLEAKIDANISSLVTTAVTNGVLELDAVVAGADGNQISFQTGSFGKAAGTLFTLSGGGTVEVSPNKPVDGDIYQINNGGVVYSFVASDAPVPADVGNTYFFATGSTAVESIQNLVVEINDNISSVVSASSDVTELFISGAEAGTAYNGIIFSTGSAGNISQQFVLGGGTVSQLSPLAPSVNDEYRIVKGSDVYRFIASAAPIPSDDLDGDVYFFATGSTAADSISNLADKIQGSISNVVTASAYAEGLALTGSQAGTGYNGVTFLTGSAGSFTTLFTLSGGTGIAATSYPFSLQTLGEGVIYNNSTGANDSGALNSDGSLVSGSADNLRWEISNVNSAKGTFTLAVRRGDDATKNKVILETFNNLSLDPNSDNYIEKVIGNQYTTISTDGTSKFVTTVGEYENRSNYVRVSAVHLPTLNYLANDGVSVNTDENGISFASYLPSAQVGSFHGATGEIVVAGMSLNENITSVSTDAQGLAASDYTDIVAVLGNRDDYQFNVLVTPGLLYENNNFTSLVQSFISLVEDRGDAIYVPDLVQYGTGISTVVSEAEALNSSYAASYWPWLKLRSATGKDVWAPASVVIPGVFAANDNAAAPWFAPAGLVRGGIPGVLDVERKLPRTSRDTLYDGKINPIASFPGAGLAVFGQKTLQTKASALDRVNVRRLLIELKKEIADVARNLVFEQNTITTRNRFLARVNPYLESVVQRQGLYSYRVVMDDSNNTADVIDRNQLIGQIYIQPAKTAEFVVLDFTIEPTGATFGA